MKLIYQILSLFILISCHDPYPSHYDQFSLSKLKENKAIAEKELKSTNDPEFKKIIENTIKALEREIKKRENT